MQKIMKTLILLFSLVSFCTVLSNAKPVLSGGRVMVENAAVGMSAGFTNNLFLKIVAKPAVSQRTDASPP